VNKSELIAAVADKSDKTRKDTEQVISAFIDVVTDALSKDEKVQLVGFGTFEVRKRAARKGINPLTKAPIDIAASKTPVFKAGKVLKDSVK
jgi:DNA-binding protein HU-beta